MRVSRLNAMEDYILRNEAASLQELASHFGVSINTVRRDMAALSERGNVKKVYGGVSAAKDIAALPTVERVARNLSEKVAVGRLAAQLVRDNSTIFLDSGTTTPQILPFIAEKENVTVVTHNLEAIQLAVKYPNLRLLSVGGMYNHITSAFYGDIDEVMSQIRFETIFVATSGISMEWGLANNTYEENRVKKVIANHPSRLVLMADHSKFDCDATWPFCDLDDLYAIVTDRRPPQPYVDFAASKNILLSYEG